MTTIGVMLQRHKGFGPGFDFMRVALALSVVGWHTYVVLGFPPGANDLDHSWFFWFPGYAILAMFFALSGFLIAGSGMRLKLKDFLINRGMRIIPALAVEIVLSALILGPIFTTLPLGAYFKDPGTYHYFTNIIGVINYMLPGVFKTHADPYVNASLWTVPFEYACYAIMSGLIVFGVLKQRGLVIGLAALVIAAGLAVQVAGIGAGHAHFHEAHGAQALFETVINFLFLGKGSRLFPSFLLGIAIYLYRDKVPYHWGLFGLCAVVCVVVALLGPAPWLTQPVLNVILCPALVYMTAFLGVTKFPILPLYSKGDYSYGIYLYGFPVQQALTSLFPGLTDHFSHFIISMVLITAFAAFSWHVIEKPILKFRKKFSFVARERLSPEEAKGADLSPVLTEATGAAPSMSKPALPGSGQ